MNFSKLICSKLFNGLNEKEIFEELKKVSFIQKTFHEGETIFHEGEELLFIGLIVEGSVDVVHVSISGKQYKITTLSQGDTIGEAVLFSSHSHIPATVVAREKSFILFFDKSAITKLIRNNERILRNYLRILSDRILMMNKRLKESTLMNLRQRICNYLLEQYKKTKSLTIELPSSKEDLAELFGVHRPSLSRELIRMRDEGIIDFHGRTIKIQDLEKVEDIVYESFEV
ncbi:Crp/Fnr family transcriptional regulator [Pseudothermotoga thermarum]|uniref:Transcriptional regulator, Crp/Fnr family n=1 Tax=Pseudothermotoga thermarum DSM 5069 TaxID=688269 RepID=F7YTX3_9THEM|nr:Crp/Fnr family transcriptional regulator [Pseudothermotoga thermarum]AEH51424.1 transcriptional regulator, Crp/Fnr family [Pseudothermotoga thermarum DSM 5069]